MLATLASRSISVKRLVLAARTFPPVSSLPDVPWTMSAAEKSSSLSKLTASRAARAA